MKNNHMSEAGFGNILFISPILFIAVVVFSYLFYARYISIRSGVVRGTYIISTLILLTILGYYSFISLKLDFAI
jgi:hypothetical protein